VRRFVLAKYVKPDAFDDAARRYFAFLLERGFVGPDVKEYRLLFTSQRLSVNVLYDDSDGRVITLIEAIVGDRNPIAGLQCLYVEAGLGPAQRIRDIARSAGTLDTALASQSSALQELIPVIEGVRGAAVLIKCHGR
jgi:hypothetical protein